MGSLQHPTRASALLLSIPGLGAIVQRQAISADMRPGAVGFDGRSDVIAVSAASWSALRKLRTVEDVLADLGSVRLRRTARATAAQVDHRRFDAVIGTLRAAHLVPPTRTMRVVVRLNAERHFHRTALRDELGRSLHAPAGRPDRPAVELWAIQTGDELRVGIRLPGVGRRDQPSRPAERPDSLRPSVAAAMLELAQGARTVLDPTCGAGTILLEALAADTFAVGGDHDPTALSAARTNGCPYLTQLDARQLPFRANAYEAVVANLPFGRRHAIQGAPVAWYRRALTEALRVAPRAVVLAPASTPFRQALGRLKIDITARYDIHLLGQRATIWSLRR